MEAGRALYDAPATASEMAAAGLTAEDYEDDWFEVWPENWQAYRIFRDLQSQWRVGLSGRTGLDYNVLFRKMDRLGLSPDDYERLEEDVRVMEFAALSVMNKKA